MMGWAAPPPAHPFDEGPIGTDELLRVVKRSKLKSSPSPLDQITYLVLRRCPALHHALLDLFNLCWVQHCVPRSWKEGVVCLIAKPAAVQNPHARANFRPIALTSCVGKVYTSILKNRWLSFVVGNGYLDTTTQKAFLPGVPGCVEHFQKLSAMIEDAHKKHRSLVARWLDLYGSVPHQLISFCLKHYNAPQSFLESVADIYDGLSAVITTKKWSTAPVSLRKGVYQGDPLSPNIGHGNLVRLSEESSSLWDINFLAVISPPTSCSMLTTHVW